MYDRDQPGFPVRILPNLGSRELVDPALMRGLIQRWLHAQGLLGKERANR